MNQNKELTINNLSTDSETIDFIKELENVNVENIQTIEKFKKFAILLDKIEISIKLKAKQNIKELQEIKNSIDEDIEIFKLICLNTKN